MSHLGSSFRKFDSWKLSKVVMVFQKHMRKQHRPASHPLVAKTFFSFLLFSDFLDATATGGAAAERQERNSP